MTDSAASLRARWKVHAGTDLSAMVYQGLWDELRAIVGDFDGRIDLRGLPISSLNKPAADIDLSYGKIFRETGFIKGSPAENCRFHGFRFGPEPLSGRLVSCDLSASQVHTLLADCIDVSFERAKLRGYIGNGCEMLRVNFSQSKISKAGFSSTRYEECDFSHATIEANLAQSTFVGCNLTGTRFEGCLVENSTVFEGCVGIDDGSFIDCEVVRGSGPTIR